MTVISMASNDPILKPPSEESSKRTSTKEIVDGLPLLSYVLTLSGQLKLFEFALSMTAMYMYLQFYFLSTHNILEPPPKIGNYKLESDRLEGGYCFYKYSTIIIFVIINVGMASDIFRLREMLNRLAWYLTETLLYMVGCYLSIICGYFALATHFNNISLRYYDSMLIVAALASFATAAFFIFDCCRLYAKESRRFERHRRAASERNGERADEN